MLCCALFVGTSAWAKTEDGEAAAKSEPVSANEEELIDKILSKFTESIRLYSDRFIIMEIRTGITDLLSS